jgi:hypothetical protein
MQDVRVVVRHAGGGAGFDLALDGDACGQLPAAGERWLSVEAGPHSLFVNQKRFRSGAIKAFVAVPGADVCLWVRSAGITRRPQFLNPAAAMPEPPRPTPLSWWQALLLPLTVIVPLVVQAVADVVIPPSTTDWTSGVVFGIVLGSISLVRMWANGPTHRGRALIVAEVVLFAVLLATAALWSGNVAFCLSLTAAIWVAAFTFAAATRGGTRSADPATPPLIKAQPGPR